MQKVQSNTSNEEDEQNPMEMIENLQNTLKENPEDIEANASLALLLYQYQQDYVRAKLYCDYAVKLNPDNEEYTSLQYLIDCAVNNIEDKKYYEKILQNDSNNAEAHYELALLQFKYKINQQKCFA